VFGEALTGDIMPLVKGGIFLRTGWFQEQIQA